MFLVEIVKKTISGEGYALVSFVGAGGKTTLLYHLLRELKNNQPTLLTTTTMMFKPKIELDHAFYLRGFPITEQTESELITKEHEIRSIFYQWTKMHRHEQPTVSLFSEVIEDKVRGVQPDVLDEIAFNGFYPLILNEADGSKQKPLKAYAPHEPVIPNQTNLVFVVLGLDAFFSPLCEENVHRSERFSELTELNMEDEITPEVIVKIITHQEGFLKGIPKNAAIYIVFNKYDQLKRAVDFKLLSKHLFNASDRFTGILVTDLLSMNELFFFKREDFK